MARVWVLRNHGRIDINHLPTQCLHALISLTQQHTAVCIFELGGSIRKMATDIAQTGRAQQGICNRMQKRIGIGMTQ